MTDVPRDFDWVTARARCSVVAMLERLRSGAKANALTRNDLFDESKNTERFKFKDNQNPRGFTIWDTTGGQSRVAVDVELQSEVIRIEQSLKKRSAEFTVAVTLNDAGECKFRIDGEELDEWQVLKRALEPMLFDE